MEPRSTCCNAPVRLGSSDEGTNWHECTKCGKPCDTGGQVNLSGMPQVMKGVPLPRVKLRDERNRPRTQWPTFLRSLSVGDCFELAYPQASTCRTVARYLEIPLVWVELPRKPGGRCVLRFWRVNNSVDHSSRPS